MEDSIIVYSQPSCGMCSMIKRELTNRNVKFTVIEDTDYMKQHGIKKTPTVVINNQVFENVKEARNYIIEHYN